MEMSFPGRWLLDRMAPFPSQYCAGFTRQSRLDGAPPQESDDLGCCPRNTPKMLLRLPETVGSGKE